MKSKAKRIYLDSASATPIDPRVKALMRKLEDGVFANPDSLHMEGRAAKKVLEESRHSVARFLSARDSEIIFTSGATESNNLALMGAYRHSIETAGRSGRPHMIVSTIEHKSVLGVAKHLESLGVEISYISPGRDGIVQPKDIRKALRKETILVSVMYANNEIGTIQPILEIAKAIRHFKKDLSPNPKALSYPLFHTDATQAAVYLDMNVLKLGVDLLTMNSPKVYGPAGIGALYVKKGTQISSVVFGGGQESGLRSGRELPLLAGGFGRALEIVSKDSASEVKRLTALRDYFTQKLLKLSPVITLNGSGEFRLPNNVNVCIPGLDAEFAVYQMDERGVACSSASTCASLSEDSFSYVVEEIKPGEKCSESSLRFSLGRSTTKKDINVCLKALREVILLQQRSTSFAQK